ncbi:uncharacterized protein BJ212DRAFT_1306199 [Suillus subaureus]|uniref:Uncharacterized protein n=1 Tax=Suillus subaureus TaxID=48587 RepID=A0A9P7AVZ1_9AGAM|nr:uncharacterized protein BJ212DRAFT_1306199 [Suillus subaureus]KAG1796576.1 hypothetical protein BJ212DRAFT_1306199 [Suillus subaureus]
MNYPVIELKDRPIIETTIAERQQQIDVVSHEVSGLRAVMGSINNLCDQLDERSTVAVHDMWPSCNPVCPFDAYFLHQGVDFRFRHFGGVTLPNGSPVSLTGRDD